MISIHAPREGSDPSILYAWVSLTDFNPRSPRGERQLICRVAHPGLAISIHAPREGSD